MEKTTISNSEIVDIYDNEEFNPDFRTGFGFGAVVKLKDKNILFDTGGDSPTLLSNLMMSGISPKDISMIVLSHTHDDHTGGLMGFLEENQDIQVVIPASFPSSFRSDITKTGAEIIEITDAAELTGGIYSTGELGTSVKEQSLIIDSDKGLIVITGCAHPGIADIVKTAKELMNKDICLVMGGFHHPPASTPKELKELGVEKIAPSHCTGETIPAFEEEYKEDFIESGVGKIIRI